MEEGFYEIDVNTLKSTMLYQDANAKTENHVVTGVNPHGGLLPGAHGKGLYSGQGVMVFSNNGEATKEAMEKFDVEADEPVSFSFEIDKDGCGDWETAKVQRVESGTSANVVFATEMKQNLNWRFTLWIR